MISELRLQHFRSYGDARFRLSDGVTIVVGPNASGKTNLLEAVLVLARGSSYRVRDADLIEYGAPWARLDAVMGDETKRTVKLVAEPKPAKTYEIDGKLFKRLTAAHSLPAVLFEPNHLQLLSGSPEGRRSYLDDLLEQTVSGYGTTLRQYRRALAQRNVLLKSSHPNITTLLFPWNVRLSELAGQIVRERVRLSQLINEQLTELYQSISHTETVLNLQYESKLPFDNYESHLLKRLDSHIDIDRQRGFTTSGPHREDFSVAFNGHAAAESASRGEARTAVLALKIIELQLLKEARETAPLLLLDDVFSELDSTRRAALTGYLKDYQTVITTTDADVVIANLHNAEIIKL